MSEFDLIDMDAKRVAVDMKKPGPKFKLEGQMFHCLPALPGVAVQRIALALRMNAKQEQVYDAPNVIGFIEDCLRRREWIDLSGEPEDFELLDELTEEQQKLVADEGGYWEDTDDRQRFRTLIESDDPIIELDTLGELMGQIQAAYGERPTQPSRRTRRGR